MSHAACQEMRFVENLDLAAEIRLGDADRQPEGLRPLDTLERFGYAGPQPCAHAGRLRTGNLSIEQPQEKLFGATGIEI